ncbi:MAG: hypothetical protein SOW78_02295 [Clostridia bacterium]|nr:hypothetical protein [Clostridia bacterium]
MELKTLRPVFRGNSAEDIRILYDYVNSLREEISFCLDNISSKTDLILKHIKEVNPDDGN